MRVILADDQPKVRYAMRALLQRNPDLVIVAEVDDIDALQHQAESLIPNLVISDWLLPGINGVGLVAAIKAKAPDCYIIATSGQPEARTQAILGGVDVFVSKMDPPEMLLAAIDYCLDGYKDSVTSNDSLRQTVA